MSKRVRTIIEHFDDMSGEMIPEGQVNTITFSWEGVGYEIDLNPENAAGLREVMGRITDKARRLDGRRLPAARRATASHRAALEAAQRGELPKTAADGALTEHRREIRQWARANGFPDQSMVGKIRVEVYDAWDAAHPDRKAKRPTD